MDEAERCNILGLMNEGRIVAFGTPADLKEDLPTNFYEISTSCVLECYNKLLSLDFIGQAALFGDKIHIMTDKGEIFTRDNLQAGGVSVEGINRINPSLEDVFVYHIAAGRGVQE
jgi:ABC-2 type transport system ATP-binding protein